MTVRKAITKAELDTKFICEPLLGSLTWIRYNMPAGTTYGVSTDGYTYVVIDGTRYPMHHLIWLHVHGKLPEQELDHINRCKTDNSITNLRITSKLEQIKNTSKVNRNGNYLPGVNWYKATKSFRVFHKAKFYGYYPTLLDAACAKFNAIAADGYSTIRTAYGQPI